MNNYIGMTLAQVAKAESAIVPKHLEQLVVAKCSKSKNMYFSGDVILHLSVKVDGNGLNNTSEWPHYLVDDNGIKKILSA